MKALVIDPSKVVQDFCVAVCSSLGMSASTCSNGHQAMDLLDSGEYELVIVNPLIKKNSGLELIYEANSYNDLQGIKWVLLADNPEVYKANIDQLATLGVVSVMARTNLSTKNLHGTLKALVHA